LEKLIAVISGDEDYGKRLSAWINENKRCGFIAIYYSTVDSFFEKPPRTEPERVLITQDVCGCFFEIAGEQLTEKAIVLCEDPKDEGGEKVFRYKRCDSLISSIFPSGNHVTDDGCRMISVFSPSYGADSIDFSRRMCKSLSQRGRTLFLSFSPFPDKRIITDQCMSDFIYAAKEKKTEMGFRKSAYRNPDGYDEIPGVLCYRDINEFSAEDGEYMLRSVKGMLSYSYIVTCIQTLNGGTEVFLRAGEPRIVLDPMIGGADSCGMSFLEQMKFTGEHELLSNYIQADIDDESLRGVLETFGRENYRV